MLKKPQYVDAECIPTEGKPGGARNNAGSRLQEKPGVSRACLTDFAYPFTRRFKGGDMKMIKPKNADLYDWNAFITFFKRTYPNIEFEAKCEEEYWEFWKAGYIRAVNA